MNYTLKNLIPIYKRLKMMNYLNWNNPEDLKKAEIALKGGSPLAGTSDTVLGLLADVTYGGFLSLNALKERSEKNYLILIESKEKARFFVDDAILLQIENILRDCWPGPLTVVVPAKKEIAEYLKAQDGTIALRVPRHEGLQKLLASFRGLFSTSANRSGKPVPSSFDALDPCIKEQVMYALYEDDVKKNGGAPSTIVQWVPLDQKLKLIRQGAYPWSDLENSKLF